MENPKNTQGKRLQVFLAHAGVASRRSAEKLITEGRVRVNGKLVTALGAKVYEGDEVSFDGKRLEPEKRKHYLALHKPPLYICSSHDPEGRALARELLPKNITERMYTVGRLDYRSSGLILFTNDGDFAAQVSHPSRGVEKEYLIEATAPIAGSVLDAFQSGVEIEGEIYQSLDIERISQRCIKVVLVEGKNREIRRVFSHFHLHPQRLHRVRIGPVSLGNLAEGASRPLTDDELDKLILPADQGELARNGDREV